MEWKKLEITETRKKEIVRALKIWRQRILSGSEPVNPAVLWDAESGSVYFGSELYGDIPIIGLEGVFEPQILDLISPENFDDFYDINGLEEAVNYEVDNHNL